MTATIDSAVRFGGVNPSDAGHRTANTRTAKTGGGGRRNRTRQEEPGRHLLAGCARAVASEHLRATKPHPLPYNYGSIPAPYSSGSRGLLPRRSVTNAHLTKADGLSNSSRSWHSRPLFRLATKHRVQTVEWGGRGYHACWGSISTNSTSRCDDECGFGPPLSNALQLDPGRENSQRQLLGFRLDADRVAASNLSTNTRQDRRCGGPKRFPPAVSFRAVRGCYRFAFRHGWTRS